MFDFIYVHDLSPYLIKFGEGIGIRWYGLAYLAGFLAGYFLLRWQKSRGWLEISEDQLTDVVLVGALSGVLGGRLGYVFLYGLKFLLRDPLYLLRIWEGGMSIHGGLLGALLGVIWFARKHNINFWELADAGVLVTPPGLMFGRIANFINGELWGRPTAGSWGVIFPRAPGDFVPRHPSQLYEALLEGPLLFGLLYLIRRYFCRDGVLTAGFLVNYGLIRFFVEFFRAPDPFIGYELFGMTRGQEYSLVMIFLGLCLYFWSVWNQPRSPQELS